MVSIMTIYFSFSHYLILFLQEAKINGDSITVETCPHYLAFSADEIPDGDTRFKCAPPIRDAANKEKLWEALRVFSIPLCLLHFSLKKSKLKFFSNLCYFREEISTC